MERMVSGGGKVKEARALPRSFASTYARKDYAQSSAGDRASRESNIQKAKGSVVCRPMA